MLTFLSLCLPHPAGAAGFPALAELAAGGPKVTALALDLSDGRVLADLDAGQRLTPASLTKLTVAATALDHWGADHTFTTRLLTTGAVQGGQLAGDLILQGGGDPSVEAKSLWSLAAQVRSAGITTVRGRLLVNPAPFGTMACETKDRCDALRKSDRSFNAPLGAMGVDYGTWCSSVRPGAVGAPAQVRGCEVAQLPIPVQGEIRTVRAGGRSTLWMERVTTANGDELHVGGDIPASEPQEVYRAMSDPPRGAGLLFKQMLREIGVAVAGDVIVTANANANAGASPGANANVPPDAAPLAQITGLSTGEQLGRMLRYSNNYIADVLTLDLAADLQGHAPGPLAQAAGVLTDVVPLHLPGAPANDRACGQATEPPLLHSGSGLTPENLLSACDLVSLLTTQYRDTRHFPPLYGALVVPRDSPFGFLRQGGDAWLDRVALKTGSMDDPHSVLGIAGYLRKKDGGFIAFAAIVNGGGAQPHVPLARSMQAARTDVEALLGKY